MKIKKRCGIFGVVIALFFVFALSACQVEGPPEEDNKDPVTYTVTFDYNYEGAPAAVTQTVKSGESVQKPEDPTRGLYIFETWYTESTCETEYVFTSAITQDITLYAGWTKDSSMTGQTEYIFEAEYIDGIEDMRGMGYSGGATGTAMILNDRKMPMGASNGFYISYLYQNGLTLEYVIQSDRDVSDAKLVLRLSAEMMDITINGDKYAVIVNGTPVEYDDISFLDVPPMTAQAKYPFRDYTITTSLSLKAGENVIQLKTNNDEPMGGTMSATAPLVDCMKIYTTAVLTWSPNQDNTNNR